MTRLRRRAVVVAAFVVALSASRMAAANRAPQRPSGGPASGTEPIVYTVRIPNPESHYLEIEAVVPTDGAPSIELMMPTWSPGYYRVERYAEHVDRFAARDRSGRELVVEKPQPNRWRVHADGAPAIVVSYRVFGEQRSVTTNYVDGDYAVINGAPTFVTLVESRRRPHDVQLELPHR